MMKSSLGIYIHIPFCVQKCHYCDFCSAPADDDTKGLYTSALIKNIASASEHFTDKEVDSVFFGGGTPTCLSADTLLQILDTVKRSYSVSNNAEITLECNPATVSFNDLKRLSHGGFTRLSLGLQSVHDEELKALGRIHSFEDFDKTYRDARAAGFGNINIDLMYGIPRQTEESFLNTLKKVISYAPEHISAYALKIEPGTLFFKNKASLILPDEDSEYNMYKLAVNELFKAGYLHYEISNYAKKGYTSLHNLKYWSCDDYVGFGISAHSCIGRDRYAATSSIKQYVGSMLYNDPNNYFTSTESLSSEEFAEEYIMMRLRLKDGLSVEEYKKKFLTELPQKYSERMVPFIQSGHIIYNNGRYSFSDDGMYLSNYILTEILDLE